MKSRSRKNTTDCAARPEAPCCQDANRHPIPNLTPSCLIVLLKIIIIFVWQTALFRFCSENIFKEIEQSVKCDSAGMMEFTGCLWGLVNFYSLGDRAQDPFNNCRGATENDFLFSWYQMAKYCENPRPSIRVSEKKKSCLLLPTFSELFLLPALGQTLLGVDGQTMVGGGHIWTTVKKKMRTMQKKREKYRGEIDRQMSGYPGRGEQRLCKITGHRASLVWVFQENPGAQPSVSLCSRLLVCLWAPHQRGSDG